MLAPISSGRRDKGSSFKRLKDYLTKERDPVTGEDLMRGEVILSDNLLSLGTAHIEMKATAAQNVLCKDPIYHYEITWHPGERPSREQWLSAATRTLRDLGFAEHEYLIAAHDDKAHFHVHIMVNRVHPETHRSPMPYRDMFSLDKAMRELEHEQGWIEDVGHHRWDKQQNIAVKNTREEMRALSQRAGCASGKAAALEHYRDEQSLQAYVKGKPAAELQMLLARHTVSWSDIHTMLNRHGLEIQKADHGGYTVHAIDSELYVKASDGFRRAFAGKVNRARTEQKLGPWCEPSPEDQERGQMRGSYEKRPARNPERLAQRLEEREAAREALKQRFGAYRGECRSRQKGVTESTRQRRSEIFKALMTAKKQIRAQDIAWKDKRVQLSLAIAKHVLLTRQLRAKSMRDRLAVGPVSYEEWVMREAEQGDVAAASQLRGWRYRDRRLTRKMERVLGVSRNVVHLSSANLSDDTGWDHAIIGDKYRELDHSEKLAKAIAAFSWKVDRRTGNVLYSTKEAVALVDQGKAISVVSTDEAAVVLALEMAVRKYGTSIKATGAEEWKRTVALIAARNDVAVEFTDSEMQRTFAAEQLRLGNPAAFQKQFSRLAALLEAAPSQPLQFCGRLDSVAFLESLWPSGTGKGLLADLERGLAVGETRRQNLKGICELVLGKDSMGQISYSLICLSGRSPELAAVLTKAGAPQARKSQIVQSVQHSRSRTHVLSNERD